jgi:hypothetical protein
MYMNFNKDKKNIRDDVKKEMNLLVQVERTKNTTNNIAEMKNDFINFLENTNQEKEGYSLSILITHFFTNYLSELHNQNVSFNEEMLIDTFKDINNNCIHIYNSKYEETTK